MTLNFEFKRKDAKSRKAVLLFHGLTGSPFELKKYGKFLYQNGYDVYADCIPGHGNNVEEIYTVTYQDWLDFSYKKFEKLYSDYEEVYVSGLCLGAVLALAVGIRYPDKVKGVAALSTTLFLDGWRLPWYSFLLPLGLSTILRFYYNYPECEPHGIKNESVRKVIKKLLQKGEVGMNDFPMTGIYELLKLSKYVRKNLTKFQSPILIVHSDKDDLCSTKSADVVFEKISSQNKEKIILHNSYHMVLYDNEKDYVFEKVLNFFNRQNSNPKEKDSILCC